MKRDAEVNWDDLRVFVEVASSGTLTRASRRLGLSVATVGRRLDRLEESLGRRLFRRHAAGLTLTPESQELLEYAQAVRERVDGLLRASASSDEQLRGTVTVTTLETVATKILAPALVHFRVAYPGIKLVLRAETHMVSLARRAADIAVRLARPRESRVVAQKVGVVQYGLFASPVYLERKGRPELPLVDLTGHDLVTYDERFDMTPEMAWLHARADAEDMVLRVTTASAISAAVEAGVGIGLLPRALVPKSLECLWDGPDLPSRDIWLVMHEDLRHIPRIRSVFEYLRDVITGME